MERRRLRTAELEAEFAKIKADEVRARKPHSERTLYADPEWRNIDFDPSNVVARRAHEQMCKIQHRAHRAKGHLYYEAPKTAAKPLSRAQQELELRKALYRIGARPLTDTSESEGSSNEEEYGAADQQQIGTAEPAGVSQEERIAAGRSNAAAIIANTLHRYRSRGCVYYLKPRWQLFWIFASL